MENRNGNSIQRKFREILANFEFCRQAEQLQMQAQNYDLFQLHSFAF